MPGPGSGVPEHEFRRRRADELAREGARVFAAIYRCIAEHTVLAQEQAEDLARAVADTHTATLAKRRRSDRSSGSTPAASEDPHG